MLFANVRLSFGGSGAWRLPVPCDPSRLAVPGALRLPASCDPRCLAASGALRSQVPCGFRCLAASDTRFCRKRGGEVDQIGTSTAMCEICGEAMACGARSARKMRSKSGDVRLRWAEKCRCEKEIGAFGPHIGPDVPSAYAGCRTSAPTCHQRTPAAAHRPRRAIGGRRLPHIALDVPPADAGCRTSRSTCHRRTPIAAHRARRATGGRRSPHIALEAPFRVTSRALPDPAATLFVEQIPRR